MKNLILNCLSESDKRANDIISNLIDTLQKSNHIVVQKSIVKLNIQPCNSCTAQYSFNYSTTCRCEDDMNQLLPEFREADNWIFVANLADKKELNYLKNLLDRMEPLFQPESFLSNGYVFSAGAGTKLKGNLILINFNEDSNSTFFERISKHFDSISLLYNKFFGGTFTFDTNTDDKNELIRVIDSINNIHLKNQNLEETTNQ